MNKKIRTFLQYAFFLLLAGVLLWLAFRGIAFEAIKEALRSANYRWILLSVILGIVSHISRSIRWNMLIKPLGYTPRLINTFFAVMIGYFANLAFPRLGELSKCEILRRYEGVPINKLLGTMIMERAADLVSLIILIGIVFIFEFHFLKETIRSYLIEPVLGAMKSNSEALLLIGLTIIFLIAAGIWFLRKFRHIPLLIRFRELAVGFVEGLKSIGKMDNAWAFVLHSVFIWSLYYTMTYVAFFAFGETAHLGLMAGLVVFVFGSIGMVMPLPGGIGSYHSLVRLALSLYAVPAATAAAFATAIHAGQTFGIILLGFLSLSLLPILNGKKTAEENENA